MTSLRTAAWSLALAGTALTAVHSQQADDYCASQPPPKGLVARCQSKDITVPASEAALRTAITDWVRTCVSKNRAPELVEAANDSVSNMWELIKDLPKTRTITILPEYEPLTFTRAGKTCYGVEAVEFSIKRPGGAVDLDGPIDVTPVPRTPVAVTDAEIREAAAAATKALLNSSTTDHSGLSKFRGVLDGLQKYGKDFDDVWYPVAPDISGDSCYRFRGTCAAADAAVKNCTRHLAAELVMHYRELKDKPERFTEALEIQNSSLFRNFQYFRQMAARDSVRDLCPALRDVLIPKVSEHAKRGGTSLYWYY